MSQENVEIVRQLYELVLASGRVEDPAMAEIVPRFFDPEVEVRQMSRMLDTAGEFHGYKGLADSVREVIGPFAALRWVPEEIRAAGDQVAAAVSVSGAGRLSGAPIEIRIGHLFTLRDGRVVRFEVFDD